MARKLRTFDFDTVSNASYPWDDWEDGSIWEITRGADFEVTLKSMQSQLYLRAYKYGLKVRTRFKDGSAESETGSIVFQFSEQPTKNGKTKP